MGTLTLNSWTIKDDIIIQHAHNDSSCITTCSDFNVGGFACVLVHNALTMLPRKASRIDVVAAEISAAQMPPAWKEYVTNVLLESGYVSKATIVGHDGKRWATSNNFEVSSSEIQAVVEGFIDPTKLQTGGIVLAGKSYVCTRMDSVVMVGRLGTGWGCVIYKCRTCLVIGVYEEGAHPGGCFNMITKLGDYFRDQGL